MTVGSVVSVRRYPVKSMQGEEINGADITDHGILGDRAYALMEQATGHIASAKYPGKWSKLLECRARFVEPPQLGKPLPAVWITLPDGIVICSSQPDIDRVLSNVLGRDVTLLAQAPANPTREADRTPTDDSSHQETIQQEPVALAAPVGTFFDYSAVHILTTATVNRFRELYPTGQFEMRRFRPNIVVSPDGDERDFIENQWLGSLVTIGAETQLSIIDPCPRCVMTTLPQADLPHDPDILRTVGQHNRVASVTLAPGVIFPAVAGVYASVLHPGRICRGDLVALSSR